jgi:hypothetical protein
MLLAFVPFASKTSQRLLAKSGDLHSLGIGRATRFFAHSTKGWEREPILPQHTKAPLSGLNVGTETAACEAPLRQLRQRLADTLISASRGNQVPFSSAQGVLSPGVRPDSE